MPDYRVPKCVESILAGVEVIADVVVPQLTGQLTVEAAILHAACDQRVLASPAVEMLSDEELHSSQSYLPGGMQTVPSSASHWPRRVG